MAGVRPSKCLTPWAFWLNRFQWEIVAKHFINPKKILLRGYTGRHADSGVAGRRGWKKQVSGGANLNLDLYVCPGEKGQEKVLKRRPYLELGDERYPRVRDAMEGEFKKERNEIYEVYQLLSRKQ